MKLCQKYFLLIILACFSLAHADQNKILKSADFYKMRSVKEAEISPDGKKIAYTVTTNPQTGKSTNQIWVIDIASGRSVRLLGEKDSGSGPRWSNDSEWLAFAGTTSDKDGLMIARADGSGVRFLSEVKGTNSPLTYEGEAIDWSPDSKTIAFVSTTPGPETELAKGDPVVITRYLYKPNYEEGSTRFNDNRRRHIFVVDVQSGKVEQKTTGNFEEHSIDWSPDGKEILFVSNREPDPDLFYNPDLFALKLSDGSIRRLTATESAEFQPRWSPDGSTIAFMATKRGLTDLETDMEDTHIWIMNADGSNRKEIGRSIDNRQNHTMWSHDGKIIYCLVSERGASKVYGISIDGSVSKIVDLPGLVQSVSVSNNSDIAYAYMSETDLSQLYIKTNGGESKKLTDLNSEILKDVKLADIEAFTFISNDFKYEIEAFLTKPINLDPS
ncbi:MAG TPA: hypothetical protein VLH08_13520, partial [Acidobacteriota bacterium]|nr:hypothetical protein [Acidobacteriota bacterium]